MNSGFLIAIIWCIRTNLYQIILTVLLKILPLTFLYTLALLYHLPVILAVFLILAINVDN